ncbi:MAG: autotransporter outer membrane beta-barrel domain-containing protein, partial [Lysobacteraceae bacterium]
MLVVPAGSYATTVRSTDDAGYSVDVAYTLAIDAPVILVDPATLPDGDVGTAYSAALSASGGAAPYSYSLLSGVLPVGMSFSSAGQFSGTPRSDGSFSLTVRATDANGNTGTQAYSFSIAAPTLAITPATLPAGTTNIAYSQALASSGGIAPYSYSLVSGSLPVGISFTSAGVFAGTPTTAGSYTTTVRSTDDAGYSVDNVYTFAIDAPTISIDPETLDAAVVGDAYTVVLAANGGAAPYAFALESGALPPGIGLDGAGGFNGTPGASGTFNFSVRATDSNGNSGTRAYTLRVDPRTLVLAPASLAAATAGTAYTATFSASGGIAPYSYALGSGALPAGLALADGV